jgi:hypothetical protein
MMDVSLSMSNVGFSSLSFVPKKDSSIKVKEGSVNSSSFRNTPVTSRRQDLDTSTSVDKSQIDTSLAYFKVEPGMSFELSEQLLIRDLLFVFQGIDGRYIKFDHKTDGYTLAERISLPASTKTLVTQLSELGWLYRKICSFISRQGSDPSLGLVGQSFSCALQNELGDYYRLVAILESQVHMIMYSI